jgi:perosamine synthetase
MKKQIVKNINLASPDISNKEIKAVVSVLKTIQLSLGPKLPEFEKIFAKYIGCKYAVAVNSGTSALHLIIKSLGIKDGHEVITTPFSFVASSNCILFERAKPVFVDIDPDTYCIDTKKIEEKINKKTKAILAVDVFAMPANWSELKRIAKKHNLYLVEDSAEALGSIYKNKKAGSFGDASIFAFYPNKQITTGEGGIILTNNEEIATLCASLRNQGHDIKSSWLEHPQLGYNYRLSDINCALGIAQLERINELIKKRSIVARWYNEELKNIKDIKIPVLKTKDAKINLFVYVIQLGSIYNRQDRKIIMDALRKQNIGCREYFPVIHLQKFYRKMFGYKKGDFPVAEHVSDRTIALPFHTLLTKDEVERVTDALKKLI